MLLPNLAAHLSVYIYNVMVRLLVCHSCMMIIVPLSHINIYVVQYACVYNMSRDTWSLHS